MGAGRQRRGSSGLVLAAMLLLAVCTVALSNVFFALLRVPDAPGLDGLKRDLIAVQIGGACVLGAFLLVLLRWGVTRQTRRAAAGARRLAQGDLDAPVDGGGPAAQISAALEELRLSLRARREAERDAELRRADEEAQRHQAIAAKGAAERLQGALVKLVGVALARLAQGDLTARIRVEVPAEFRHVKEDFNRALEDLQWAMVELTHSSGQLAADAGRLSEHSGIVARRAARQAHALTSALRQLGEAAAALDDIARETDEAGTAAAAANEDARLGARTAGRAGGVMRGLEDALQEIVSAVAIVDEIAFKTNLLALNAGVEAARAGEAGRGFAVVAAEVRRLAESSASAAAGINSLLAAFTTRLGEGARLVAETGGFLRNVDTATTELGGSLRRIAARLREKKRALGQADAALHDLESATDKTAELAEKLAAASARLEEDGRAVESLPARYKSGQGDAGRGLLREPVDRASGDPGPLQAVRRLRAGGTAS